MNMVTKHDLEGLYRIDPESHKGQNGRLLLIGGSTLFHSASLWSLTVASRIVDLVHYASTDENNAIVQDAKASFRSGIVIHRKDIESYIAEDDAILIGPGMVRSASHDTRDKIYGSLSEMLQIEDEGVLTGVLTNYLLEKYPQKQWVIDAGALQMIAVENIPRGAILTPHHAEFAMLFQKSNAVDPFPELPTIEKQVEYFAKRHHCIVLHKGVVDYVYDGNSETSELCAVEGGNEGMTKGGTGDVLAGLIAALATKNSPILSTIAGSYLNKKAGESLYTRVGPFFNASDLVDELPHVMKELLYDA